MKWQLWIFEIALVLLPLAAPVGLIYCWGYVAREWERPFSWREKVSVAVLIAVTSAALACLGMVIWVAPLETKEDWERFVTYTHVFRYVGRGLLGMIVVALLGRPRLAPPLIAAIVGTLACWAVPIILK